MQEIIVDGIQILVGREDDGRWWADIEALPGVMSYGATCKEAVDAARSLAIEVASDSLEHGEPVPSPFRELVGELRPLAAA